MSFTNLAEKAAAIELPTIALATPRISLKGGTFSTATESLGDSIDAVIIAYGFENTLYLEPYNRLAPKPPSCSAFGVAPSKMKSAEKLCSKCENNVFGSRGKGKACKNTRRLYVAIVEDDQIDGPFILRIPPTSTMAFDTLLRDVVQNHHVPLYGVIVKMKIAPTKMAFGVQFTVLGSSEKFADTIVPMETEVSANIERDIT